MTAPSNYTQEDLTDLPAPHYICVTPFWFRLFVAGLVPVGAVMVAVALTHAVLGSVGSLQMAVRGALALLLCGIGLRVFNPLDRRKWFCFAVTPDGLYFPGRRSGLVFVPWSALIAVDIERWYGKGEHSATRLSLNLDDESWSRFSWAARIEGKGRERRLSVHVFGMTGDEIAARIRACRADSLAPLRSARTVPSVNAN